MPLTRSDRVSAPVRAVELPRSVAKTRASASAGTLGRRRASGPRFAGAGASSMTADRSLGTW